MCLRIRPLLGNDRKENSEITAVARQLPANCSTGKVFSAVPRVATVGLLERVFSVRSVQSLFKEEQLLLEL